MLVYGTRLWFSPVTEIRKPLDVVARWLSRKVGRQLVADRFLANVDRTFEGNHQVKSIATLDEHPAVLALSYSHPDAKVAGRQWTTEIGFRRAAPHADLECTVLLSTSEISARVAASVQVTRPGVITELVRRCELSNATSGTRLHTLGEDEAEAFRHVVFDPRRNYSLIVLSPDASGTYTANSGQLSSLLLGLADIVVIPQSADTFWLAKVIGSDFVPYRGAIRLIYPAVRRLDAISVPTRVLTSADIGALAAAGTNLESELLSLVVHRSNLPLSWSHVGLQTARDLQLQRTLAQKRAEAAKSGDAQEYARFLEEHAIGLETKVADQKGTIEALEKLIAAQDDKERELRYENDALKTHLSEAGRPGASPVLAPESRQSFAAAIRTVVDGKITPEICLRLLDHLFPDRIEILPEAWQSARSSAVFKFPDRLFDLLHSLATTYWESLKAGKPDSEARQVFGASYAAKESETVTSKKEARDRRTFRYRGRHLLMLRHLKIGVKNSAAETIRVHFEWVADDGRIVIGYCGPHIPFK